MQNLYIVFLTVCSCHVMYVFESESTFYSCLNVKELLARSRRKILSLSDCNWTWTQNHLVRERTLNHLAKLVNFCNLHIWGSKINQISISRSKDVTTSWMSVWKLTEIQKLYYINKKRTILNKPKSNWNFN